MARRRNSNAGETLNAWPGFVDALSTLLMVIIFVLLVFVLAQAFLSVALSGRDQRLILLNRKIAEMSDLMTLDHGRADALSAAVGQANQQLRAAVAEKDALAGQLAAARLDVAKAGSERDRLRADGDALAGRLDDAKLQATAAQARSVALEAQQSAAAKLADTAGRNAAEQSAQLLATQGQLTARAADLAQMAGQVQSLSATRDALQRQSQEEAARATAAEQRQATLGAQLNDDSRQFASLNEELQRLRQQLGAVGTALDASEAAGKGKDVQIANLGTRLNLALTQKVEELQQYRSEFFGQLRQVLANQPGVQVVGDRFVFQSEVLFPPGKPDLSSSGLQQVSQLAQTLKDLAKRIPPNVNWLLRVDGHADRQSVGGTQYPTNWDLSAARAIKVVQLLAAEGVPPNRLAATAFGDNQPLDQANTPAAYARNRRIEIRLTDR